MKYRSHEFGCYNHRIAALRCQDAYQISERLEKSKTQISRLRDFTGSYGKTSVRLVNRDRVISDSFFSKYSTYTCTSHRSQGQYMGCLIVQNHTSLSFTVVYEISSCIGTWYIGISEIYDIIFYCERSRLQTVSLHYAINFHLSELVPSAVS